jgi:phytoene desaturase
MKDAGYGDLESRIRYERVVTPDDWEHGYAIHRGATFNLAHTLTQMLHLRPRNRFEDIDGMYLVGGGTHPGSGLPVIYEGARITSNLLCEDFGVRAPWGAGDGTEQAEFGSDFAEIPRAAKILTA